MHALLERQLKRALGIAPGEWEGFVAELVQWLDQLDPQANPAAARLRGLAQLMQRVSDAYAQQDRDQSLLRRSLELSSDELTDANERLRADAEESARALAALRKAYGLGESGTADSGGAAGLVSMAEQVAALTREREAMGLALAKSEERFDLAMRGSNDGLWDYDLVNQQVYYSPRWVAMIGETPGTVGASPREWQDRIHPADVEKTFAVVQDYLEGRIPNYEVLFRFRHREGHYLWILARGIAVRDGQGQAVRLVGTHSDVTRRVELERYLAQFKAAIDEHAIMSIADVAGNIVYANQRFKDISGYADAELIGQSHRLLKSGAHDQAFYARLWDTLAAGRTWSGEICNRARDGSLYWVLETIAPMLDDNGEPYQYVSIGADITQSKLHETQLMAAKEEAEAANRAKSEFLANMSHEIRTPMNGVLGMLDLTLDTELGREQREYLGLAYSSANALLGILNDILDFSKIEAGRLDVHLEPIDPVPLACELARLFETRCNEKGLAFSIELEPGFSGSVVADPARLRQVLTNLLSNALKFTDHGRMGLVLRREAQHVRFLVRDTGIGIPLEIQSVIFEAFTQADGSITKRFGGTGLGLTISRRLVELMGGELVVRSAPEHGSEFSFCLALAPEPKEAASMPLDAQPASASPARGLRVLLAEDNPVNQKLAVSLLSRAGCEVEVVDNGAAAVQAVAQGGFDLVFMDMQMPVLDGIEATRRIRALPGAQGRVPIIALTANAYAEDQVHCLQAGMNAFVAKPIRREALLAAIEAVCTAPR